MTPTWYHLSNIIGLCNRAYFKENQTGINILDKLEHINKILYYSIIILHCCYSIMIVLVCIVGVFILCCITLGSVLVMRLSQHY